MGNNVTIDNASVMFIKYLKCVIYSKKKGGLATAVLYPGRDWHPHFSLFHFTSFQCYSLSISKLQKSNFSICFTFLVKKCASFARVQKKCASFARVNCAFFYPQMRE